ncbi:MAG: M14 family metallopeptidase [Actinomycetota bacterium]
MRRIIVLALAAALVAAFAPAGRTDDRAGGLALVRTPGDAQRAYVSSYFDETHNYVPGHVEVLLWPGDATRLDALGYDYEITVPDVAARDARLFAERTPARVALPGPDRSDYRRLPDYNAEMKALADENKDLVELYELPEPTLEGRPVFGVEIAADVGAADGRPTFYVDGVHHAREWPAAEYPMIFAHYLVEGFGKDARITRLLKKLRVVIVPIVNPDGFDYSRESVTGQNMTVDRAVSLPLSAGGLESYWRKNRRSLSGVTVPGLQKNPDAYGVDPNRNYSYHWGGDGSSANQTSQVHRGDAPFSEPETRNVRRKILEDNVTGIITNHTYSRLVLRPWGDTFGDASDEAYLFRLGQRMADAMGGYQNIKGRQLYVTTGTMSDWGYGALGIPSYTFEHGTAFHPPYSGCSSDCVGKQWRGVMKAFLIAADAALQPKLHGILQGTLADRDGTPLRGTLTVSKKILNPLDPDNPLGDKTGGAEKLATSMTATGAFRWHLPASARPHVSRAAADEAYTLKVTVAGRGTRSFTFVLDQGERFDLGIVRF